VNGTASISSTVTAPTFTDNVNFRLSNTGVIVLNSFINANAAYRFTSNSGNIASGQLFAQADVAQNTIIYTGDTQIRIVGRGSALVALTAFNSTGNVTIGSLSDLGAKLNIQGSGATSSTTALRVQNSNASASLVVLDNGNIGIGTITPSSSLHVLGQNIAASSSFLVQNSSGQTLISALNDRTVSINNTNGTNGNTSIGTTSGTINLVQGYNNIIVGNSLTFYNGGPASTIQGFFTNPGIAIGYAQSNTNPHPGVGLAVRGTTRLSGSFNTAVSGSILTVIGSGSAQPIFTVQGSQGELFSITDSLSGSLFSVNDISGLPIMEVFSDNTILMGDYQDPMLLTTRKITQTNSGSFVVYSIPTASYDGAFIEYTIKSGSNARAGTIMSTWVGSSIEFTEVDTMDIGNTTAVGLTMILSGSNAVLTGSSSTGSWVSRFIVRAI
jgi:hypothetical protein